MISGENTTIISYKIKNGQGTFAIVPLVHCRCFHAASPLPGMKQETLDAGTILRSGIRPDIRFTLLSDGPAYVPQEMIYNNFEYEEERRRGLAWKENLFSPGRFEIELSGDAAFAIAASTWRTSMPDWRAEQKKENERLESLKAPLPDLARAADAFLVKRGQGQEPYRRISLV